MTEFSFWVNYPFKVLSMLLLSLCYLTCPAPKQSARTVLGQDVDTVQEYLHSRRNFG